MFADSAGDAVTKRLCDSSHGRARSSLCFKFFFSVKALNRTPARHSSRGRFSWVRPRRGAVLRVQVTARGGHPNRSEPQLRKGDRPWEGSGGRSRGSMHKNRIVGDVERGERAQDREASMTKAQAA